MPSHTQYPTTLHLMLYTTTYTNLQDIELYLNPLSYCPIDHPLTLEMVVSTKYTVILMADRQGVEVV